MSATTPTQWYCLAHLGAIAGVLLPENKEGRREVDSAVWIEQVEECVFLTEAVIGSC